MNEIDMPMTVDEKFRLAQLLLKWSKQGSFTHVHLRWLMKLIFEIVSSCQVQVDAGKHDADYIPF